MKKGYEKGIGREGRGRSEKGIGREERGRGLKRE